MGKFIGSLFKSTKSILQAPQLLLNEVRGPVKKAIGIDITPNFLGPLPLPPTLKGLDIPFVPGPVEDLLKTPIVGLSAFGNVPIIGGAKGEDLPFIGGFFEDAPEQIDLESLVPPPSPSPRIPSASRSPFAPVGSPDETPNVATRRQPTPTQLARRSATRARSRGRGIGANAANILTSTLGTPQSNKNVRTSILGN